LGSVGGGLVSYMLGRTLIEQSQAENEVLARVTGAIDAHGNKLLKANLDGKLMSAGESAKAIGAFHKRMQNIALATKFDETQLWQGALQGATAGLTLPQIGQMMDSTAKFAQAGGGSLTIDKAMDISTNIANAFKIPLSKLPQVQNQIAAIANSTNSTIQEVAEAIKMAAPGIMASGGNLKEALSAVAVMAQFGMKGTLGGTTLARLKEKVNTASGPALGALDKIGVSISDFKTKDGKIKSFVQMMEVFEKAMHRTGVTVNDVNAAMDKLFGLRGSRGSKLLAKDIPRLKRYYAIAEAAEKNFMGKNSALAIMSKIQMEGLYGAFEIMRAMGKSAMIDMGRAGLNEDLRSIIMSVQKAIKWFMNLDDSTKKLIGRAAMGAAAFSLLIVPLGLLVIAFSAIGGVGLLVMAGLTAAALLLYGYWDKICAAIGRAKKMLLDAKDAFANTWLGKAIGVEHSGRPAPKVIADADRLAWLKKMRDKYKDSPYLRTQYQGRINTLTERMALPQGATSVPVIPPKQTVVTPQAAAAGVAQAQANRVRVESQIKNDVHVTSDVKVTAPGSIALKWSNGSLAGHVPLGTSASRGQNMATSTTTTAAPAVPAGAQ